MIYVTPRDAYGSRRFHLGDSPTENAVKTLTGRATLTVSDLGAIVSLGLGPVHCTHCGRPVSVSENFDIECEARS